MSTCPNCGESDHVYYAGKWCAACGWHSLGQTLAHANFKRDDSCPWCPAPADVDGRDQA